MASAYSITIQVAYPSLIPFSPGHVAVVVNTPDEQVYAGFGPVNHDLSNLYGMWAPGQLDVQTVPRGAEPMSARNDFSNVFGDADSATFTIPGSESQAMTTLVYIYTLEQPYFVNGISQQYGGNQDYGDSAFN